jgi:hypothetical protein
MFVRAKIQSNSRRTLNVYISDFSILSACFGYRKTVKSIEKLSPKIDELSVEFGAKTTKNLTVERCKIRKIFLDDGTNRARISDSFRFVPIRSDSFRFVPIRSDSFRFVPIRSAKPKFSVRSGGFARRSGATTLYLTPNFAGKNMGKTEVDTLHFGLWFVPVRTGSYRRVEISRDFRLPNYPILHWSS